MAFGAEEFAVGQFRTVIDVGAFRGDFALSALAADPEVKVLSFEPLEKRPRRWMGYKRRWAWHAVALGNVPGLVTMHRNEFIPSSSVLPMLDLHREAFPYTVKTDEVEVGMATLDEFYWAIDSPALLKIDVQGFEFEVLSGAMDTLTLCEAVVCEVSHAPLYAGTPSFEDLDGLLSRAGFHHSRRVEQLDHPETKALLQSDELWVR